MLDVSDALHAHMQCRALMVKNLKQPPACMEYLDFRPFQDCVLERFVHECEQRHIDWPEIELVRSAHNSLHKLVTDLARRRISGEYVNVDAENAREGRIDNASSALVAALWRLERRLHSLAG